MNVIIVDGDYERSSSSVEDESMPMISSNPTLLSPIPTNDIKHKNTDPIEPSISSPVHNIKPITPSKTESIINGNNEITPENVWVRIPLNRVNIPNIPVLKKQLETTRPWLLQPKVTSKVSFKVDESSIKEDKQNNHIDSKSKILKEARNELQKEAKNEITKETRTDIKKAQLTDEFHRDRKQKSRKRKRRNSSSSISSHSTISNISQSSKHPRHLSKEVEDSKFKRRKDDSESRSQMENLNLTTTPPTNHEREASRAQVGRTSDPTSPISKPRSSRQYRSYFEPPDEPPDLKKRLVR